jgi:hypothetical protein
MLKINKGGRQSHWSPRLDGEVIRMYHEGKSVPQMGDILNIEPSLIQNRIKRLRDKGEDLPYRTKYPKGTKRGPYRKRDDDASMRTCNICHKPTDLGPFERFCTTCRERKVGEITSGFHA